MFRQNIRLIGAILFKANDEWQRQNRYMQTEPMAELMVMSALVAETQISNGVTEVATGLAG